MAERTFDVTDFVDAWNAHDLDRVLDHYAEEATMMRSIFPAPLHGRDAIRERLTAVFHAFEDWRVDVDPENVLQEGRRIADMVRVSGTNTNDLKLASGAVVPATGKRMEYVQGTFFDLNDDGKIVNDNGIFDVAAFMLQLGITPDMLQPAPAR